ncbi:MAG: mechanosensitive ion channel [Burkholderiales bacterium]|jgi:small-conductance mechanosensitive channel|nr:mechanosensitive ion channel [Burkholderiales bacterium]
MDAIDIDITAALAVPMSWLDRTLAALAAPMGWLDLVLTLTSIAVAYGVSWYWHSKQRKKWQALSEQPLPGGMLRVVSPLLALLLLLLARSIFHLYNEPFFLDIALPLMLALAAIRILVYALRLTFNHTLWLKTSELAVTFIIWSLVVLYFFGILPGLKNELNSIVLPLGTDVSLWTLVKGIVVLILTVLATLWVADIIERRLLPKTQITHEASYNSRLLLARFLRALLLVVAVFLALQSIGIDLTLFALLGGAIGVGIGFGLQKIVANYIAGFAVLFEHAIKIGDMVTVDGHFGVVREVTARYVVIRNIEGVDAMVPNETLLTQTVFNHSSGQLEVRITLPIRVAYGTDLPLALRLMEQAATIEPRVVADGKRAPAAFIVDFGESSINLLLGVWVRDPENGTIRPRSSINLRLWNLFDQHGIEIPFPQREVRLLDQGSEVRD